MFFAAATPIPAIIMPAHEVNTATPTPAPTLPPLRLLQKRHSGSWQAYYEHEMSSPDAEWINPCGGTWLGPNSTNDHLDMVKRNKTAAQRMPKIKILRKLQSSTKKELGTMKVDTPAIDITDIPIWSLHKKTYEFLPILKLSAAKNRIALRRWHRNLQIYVGAFAYLRRAQMHWDHIKAGQESETARELNKLKESARRVLCDVEAAINYTMAVSQYQRKQQQTKRRAVNTVTRAVMRRKLKFQTHLKHLYGNGNGHGNGNAQGQTTKVHEINPIDLKFSKHRYFSLLRAMGKLLRAIGKDNGKPSSARTAVKLSGKKPNLTMTTNNNKTKVTNVISKLSATQQQQQQQQQLQQQ